MFAITDPVASENSKACKRCLTHREWIAPQVVAVKLDQVEGVEEPIPDAVELRDPVIAARNRLAVDDAGVGAKPSEGRNNAR